MRALGITSGIGSMLQGARNAGFEIVCNLEWRDYYHFRDDLGRNTFRENFPGALFRHRISDLSFDEIDGITGVHLALGHPECGQYSNLSSTNNTYWGHDRRKEAGDIPLFVDLIKRLRPKYFLMDDLPGCLGAFPFKEFSDRLPGYDLFPEWICNAGYLNVQRYRNRFFVIGSLKSE